MTITMPETEPEVTPDEDLVVHVVCCNPDEALCGVDVSGEMWVADIEEITCPVCAILEGQPCWRCA